MDKSSALTIQVEILKKMNDEAEAENQRLSDEVLNLRAVPSKPQSQDNALTRSLSNEESDPMNNLQDSLCNFTSKMVIQ